MTVKSRPGNLPSELTSFVGRRRELAEIKRQLTTTRLLTLTGSGGVGKTRLAVRAAEEMARYFADGVWLVALAPIQDPELITQAVFDALGLHDVSSRWSLSALSDYLRARRLLLVIDNCEHLLDGVAGLAATLLRSSPELRVLATSRQPLSMAGEVRFRIPPLALPEPSDAPRPGQIAGSDAVALLVERATAVQPSFSVDDSNALSVLQLCSRLDGMPLALELAAVRLEGLTVDQLLAGLDRELSTPSTALRGAEPRQRTIEATLDWSYSLLTQEQRRLWARLSVFAGDFDGAAVMTVCAGLDLPDQDLPTLMAALVESSILQRNQSEPPRFSMLETIRHYGRHKLRQAGEELQLQRRHRDWVLELVHSASVFGPTEAEGFKAVHLERANVWAAMEFSRGQPGEAASGTEICAGLTNYWLSRGPLRDVRRYMESLALLTEPDSALRAQCLTGIALFSDALDDPMIAQSSAREALDVACRLGDANLIGWATGALLFAAFILEQSDGVADLSRMMFEAGRSVGSQLMVAIAMHYTCLHWLAQGRVDGVLTMAESGVVLCREAGDSFVRGMLLNSLAEAWRRRGDLALAEALAREGVTCKLALDDRRGLAMLLETLAWIACDRRDGGRSATLLGAAGNLRDLVGVPLLAPHVASSRMCEQRARQLLGDVSFDRALGSGAAMSVEDAAAYAIGESESKPKPAVRSPTPATTLSQREMEIARLAAEGLTNREIASRLFISSRTVETHVAHILDKLGLSSRSRLARWVG